MTTDVAAKKKALLDALEAAAREFRHRSQSYRNPSGDAAKRMSKATRQRLASEFDAHTRAVDEFRAHLALADPPR